jgi:ABC-type glycerol-3-phosphate transport system substrate-binding protein
LTTRYLSRLVVTVIVLSIVLSVNGIAAAKTTINMWFPSSFFVTDAEQQFFAKFEADFEKENPDIDLELRFVAGGTAGLNEAVAIGVATGTGPEIAYLSTNVVGRFTHSGVYGGMAVPLDNYYAQWEHTSKLLPALLESVEIEGKKYALPYMMWPINDIYNLTLFQQSGISLPTNWDEQVTAASKLTQMNPDGTVKTYGYQAAGSDFYMFYILGRTMEQLNSIIIKPGDSKGILNNQAGVQALTFIRDLYHAGTPDKRYGVRWPEVYANRVAMANIQGVTRQLYDIPNYGLDISFRRFVGPTGGTDIIEHCAGALYMLQSTKDRDAAWKVMAAFADPVTMRDYLMIMPAYQPVMASLFTNRDILSRLYSREQIALFTPPITTYGPKHPLLSEISAPTGKIILSAVQDQIAISGALQEAERIMNLTLADYLSR